MTDVASVLFARTDIRRRVQELGRAIAGDYAEREPVLITVLKGGAVFLADLMRAMPTVAEPHFMAISRYGDATESLGRVRILLDVDVDLTGRDVLLVEDIVDTGLTLRYLLGVLGARGPSSLEVCTLLDKSVRRIAPLAPRYVGFECPDRFVIGYGLDFHERYRNLPDILQVHDFVALEADPSLLAPRFAGV
ncbi:MAG TPA: hypoxanthine phosphoribosyltransferase [Actinomycetota bacterium]|nr:hypoxanthine phosphoribosyltransferase [Actinomycetota bacterium]